MQISDIFPRKICWLEEKILQKNLQKLKIFLITEMFAFFADYDKEEWMI